MNMIAPDMSFPVFCCFEQDSITINMSSTAPQLAKHICTQFSCLVSDLRATTSLATRFFQWRSCLLTNKNGGKFEVRAQIIHQGMAPQLDYVIPGPLTGTLNDHKGYGYMCKTFKVNPQPQQLRVNDYIVGGFKNVLCSPELGIIKAN